MIDKTLKQYTDLYLRHREAFDSHEAEPMRQKAFARLKEAGRLPRKGDEGFKQFSVEELFAPDYGINVSRLGTETPTAQELALLKKFRCGVPNISTLEIYVLNDRLVIPPTTQKIIPAGLEIKPLACSDKGGALQPGEISAKDGDATAAVNTLLWQDGIRISVAKGTKVEKPIQIVNLLGSTVPLAVFRRIVIDMEEGAEARVLFCDHTTDGTPPSLAHQVIETRLAENARLEIYDIEESSYDTSRLWQLFADLNSYSSLRVNLSSLLCGRSRSGLHVNMLGSGAEYYASGMAIGDRESVIDVNSRVMHRTGDCHSDQLFKFVLNDSSKGAFEGLVTVLPGADRTNANQTDRNLLLSPDARMHAEPQLLINCDDVKCTHGASTGQLDQRALFYLRSRGIPLKEAESLLVRSFMTDVIDAISLEPLRDRMHHLVEMRLSQDENKPCLTCKARQ